MAQYYTLEEAARVLHMTQDEVKKLAEEKKVRTFRDRGTLRFRAQDIDEVARSLGLGSEPELQLGEVPPPKKGSSPTPKKAPKPAGGEDVFEFKLSAEDDSDQVEIGQLPPSPGGSKSGASSSRKQRSPAPEPGSDSDVRLVADSGDDFELSAEGGPTSSPPKAPTSSTKRPSALSPGQPKKPSTLGAGEKPKSKPGSGSGKRPSKISSPDSSVRMVPMEDDADSDVKMVLEPDDAVSLGPGRGKTASDSDIRLEHSKPGGKKESDDALVTEEIDLDAEVGPPSKPTPKPGSKPGSKPASGKSPAPKLPKESPFELSEADPDVSKKGPPKSPKPQKLTQHKPADTDSSDDFELTPAAPDSSSPLELGSDEVAALPPEDEEVNLGELNAGAGDSGINLRDPADSGISLEQEGSDEIEFELSLDAGATPKPSPDKPEDSSDEFELSLDEDSSETVAASDSSEFELSLEDSGSSELDLESSAQGDDSDSEFELTLDDSGGSSPLEGAERDIFETDFEVPALEEESGSEAVALDEDTDLESSDFDLALGDEDMVAEDESGSQVVALEDEEEADEGAATVSRQPRRGRTAAVEDEEDEESEFAGIGGETEEEEEEETAAAATGKTRFVYVDAPPAPWGPLPALLLIPCVLVLFVVGLMGFELVQSMLAYQKGSKYTGLVIGPLSEAVGLGTPPGIDKKGGKK